ncbi:MAG TPA: DUF6069 family protein [Patescibacteria group bacterium]|nr:DUF6069 family protein [Patescibacteria group bacterium]
MRIALAAAIAVAVAIPVDLAVESLAREAFAVSPEFEPFQGTVAPYTAGGIGLAAVVFAAMRRLVRDADRVYVRIAAAALLLSWIPDVGLLIIHDPGATVPAVASLMVMHALAAGIAVTVLLRVPRPAGV